MENNVFMKILEKAEEKGKFNLYCSLSGLNAEGLNIANKETAKTILGSCGSALQYCTRAIQSNKELVKIAVKQDGFALQFASEKLKDDEEVVALAVRNGRNEDDYFYSPLEYASDRLKRDKQFILHLFASPGQSYPDDIFPFMNECLIDDGDFMADIVKVSKLSHIKDYYNYLAYDFEHNKKVTMAIIEHCSDYVLEDIGLNDELLMDEEFVTLALEKLGDRFIDYLKDQNYFEVYLKRCLLNGLKKTQTA